MSDTWFEVAQLYSDGSFMVLRMDRDRLPEAIVVKTNLRTRDEAERVARDMRMAVAEGNAEIGVGAEAIDAAYIENDFARQNDARRAAWLASPEGIAAAKERQERCAAMQRKHDALLARLPALDFRDPYSVLDWVCAMQEPSDHVGVIVRRDTIVAAFEKNGFRAGVNCGADYRPGDKDNMFRYLVGQALDGLKNGPSIHPIIHKFAAEWRQQIPPLPSPPEAP